MCADKAVHCFLDACVSLIIECVRGPDIVPQSGQVSARSYGHKHDKRMCANKAVHCFFSVSSACHAFFERAPHRTMIAFGAIDRRTERRGKCKKLWTQAG